MNASADEACRPESQRSREKFIPLRRARLIELLADDADLAEAELPLFLRWCHQLMEVVHREYHAKLEAIKSDYDAFNPDVATTGELDRSPEERDNTATRLFANLTLLLDRANYEHLSRDAIEQAAEASSDWGVRLNVDFEVFEHLTVFSRGDITTTRNRRDWKTAYRERTVEVPVYQRLVVMFQLREHKRVDGAIDTNAIYLKLFKNIPKQDIDMLMPCSNFQMTWLDHGKVIVPTMSGFLLAVVKGFTAATAALFTGFWGVLAFLGFIGGTAGYGVKSFLGYLRTKDKYQLSLTQRLYYQNLDNNAGVMFRILDEAEEQECREVILAYALLRRQAGDDGWTEHELDVRAESFLRQSLGFDVDFEVADALSKLQRFGCANVDESNRWRAVSLKEAMDALNRMSLESNH